MCSGEQTVILDIKLKNRLRTTVRLCLKHSQGALCSLIVIVERMMTSGYSIIRLTTTSGLKKKSGLNQSIFLLPKSNLTKVAKKAFNVVAWSN